MKTLLRVALLSAGILPLSSAPTVSNVRVSQRAGTNLVDVYYDLSGSGKGGTRITVELSDNGGTSYGLPISSLSGKVGVGIVNGRNLHLVWDAGADRPESFSETMRLRLSLPEEPDGFALIPAGTFQMGDQSEPPVGELVERPVHSVYVSEFYMGKYEVPFEEWDEVRAWGLNNGYTDLPTGTDSVNPTRANHPVHAISWNEAVKWCNARSQKEGLTPCYTVSGTTYKTGNSVPVCNWSVNGYRLPTEAEWEKAARGGVSGKNFPWGTNTITHSQANYFSNPYYSYDTSQTVGEHPTYGLNSYYPKTSPICSFTPNGYGLYDVAGNVSEFCWDTFAGYPGGATEPWYAGAITQRIIRGGPWIGGPEVCRVAWRGFLPPFMRDGLVGFRLARSSIP